MPRDYYQKSDFRTFGLSSVSGRIARFDHQELSTLVGLKARSLEYFLHLPLVFYVLRCLNTYRLLLSLKAPKFR
jgi:hypothetical protein